MISRLTMLDFEGFDNYIASVSSLISRKSSCQHLNEFIISKYVGAHPDYFIPADIFDELQQKNIREYLTLYYATLLPHVEFKIGRAQAIIFHCSRLVLSRLYRFDTELHLVLVS